MNDPYQILGISPTATDDEIKSAYRKLSQQYHPDHHTDSVMEEIANQKMSEINAAYDEIMNMRRSGGTTGNSSSPYMEIRCMIESGNYTAADNALEQNRNELSGEWNFLKGTVCLSRGWLNDAYTYYEKAVRLEPSNREYQAAFSRMQNSRNGNMTGNPYNSGRTGMGMNSANCLCNTCQFLICADCLCDCC
ncbi:MAG: DnaJ domain-containing protein [Porcipelethomonas sp.]